MCFVYLSTVKSQSMLVSETKEKLLINYLSWKRGLEYLVILTISRLASKVVRQKLSRNRMWNSKRT